MSSQLKYMINAYGRDGYKIPLARSTQKKGIYDGNLYTKTLKNAELLAKNLIEGKLIGVKKAGMYAWDIIAIHIFVRTIDDKTKIPYYKQFKVVRKGTK